MTLRPQRLLWYIPSAAAERGAARGGVRRRSKGYNANPTDRRGRSPPRKRSSSAIREAIPPGGVVMMPLMREDKHEIERGTLADFDRFVAPRSARAVPDGVRCMARSEDEARPPL